MKTIFKGIIDEYYDKFENLNYITKDLKILSIKDLSDDYIKNEIKNIGGSEYFSNTWKTIFNDVLIKRRKRKLNNILYEKIN